MRQRALTLQESLHRVLFEATDVEAERFEANKQKLRKAFNYIITIIKKNFKTPHMLRQVEKINRQFKIMERGNADAAKWLGDGLVKMLQAGQVSFPILSEIVDRNWAEAVGDEMSQYLQKRAYGDEEALDLPAGIGRPRPQEKPGPYSSGSAQQERPGYESFSEELDRLLAELL